MVRSVTCLTRGRSYEVLAEDVGRGQLKVRGDNGKLRGFPAACFDRIGKAVPTMTSWTFDVPVENPAADCVEVACRFGDGSRRWCLVATPAFLAGKWSAVEPGFHAPRLIVTCDLRRETVEKVLADPDQQGELLATALVLPPE